MFLVPQNQVFGDDLLGGIVDGFLQSAHPPALRTLELEIDCLSLAFLEPKSSQLRPLILLAICGMSGEEAAIL